MSEEELVEEVSIGAGAEAEQGEEYEEAIDLNAALLEVMVKRTEILEKLMQGEATTDQIISELENVHMPSLEKRRRRRRS